LIKYYDIALFLSALLLLNNETIAGYIFLTVSVVSAIIVGAVSFEYDKN
jgi:membrane protein implicated in regulation of membrane protease activity